MKSVAKWLVSSILGHFDVVSFGLGLAIASLSTYLFFGQPASPVYIVKDRKQQLQKAPKAAAEKDEGSQRDTLDGEHDHDQDTEAASVTLFEVLPHVPLQFEFRSPEEVVKRSRDFYHLMNMRRSVNFFSNQDVPREAIDNIILTAGTSPSGAHTEPWSFVVVKDREIKRQIREIMEEEERASFERRFGETWKREMETMAAVWKKEYLEVAPYLIVMFNQVYKINEDGTKTKHYYNEISSSIAAGFLITAIHNAGLCTLTSTPLSADTPLRQLLGRPENENVLLLLPIGYPAHDATVPNLQRKGLNDMMVVK